MRAFGAEVLALDLEAEVERLCAGLRGLISGELRRRGAVVAVSGGIDSALCAALVARALPREQILALLLPERESSPDSTRRGRLVAEGLGIPCVQQDITAVLEALGCYRERDEAIRAVVPDYGPGWRCKLRRQGGQGMTFFQVVAADPGGRLWERRLPHRAYLQVLAAQNYKQRARKTVEYYHADRLHYAVVGTPNRLEYELGFFVKNGDGSADVKPIAHLYKSQVFALARHLGVPEEICSATPTTDTYSLPQTQDEYYFALPYPQMDLALWAYEHGVEAAALGAALGVDAAQAGRVLADIDACRRSTRPLHGPALRLPLPEPAP